MQLKSLKKFVIVLLIFSSMYAYGAENSIHFVTCKSVSGDIVVKDTISNTDRDNPKRHLTFKIANKHYDFEQDKISIIKNTPVGARVEYGKYVMGYYIPIEELNSSQPFKGRIIIIKKENGKLMRGSSTGEDAFCITN